MRALLSIANGVVLGIVGIFVPSWQFWVLMIWMMIAMKGWSYLDRRDACREPHPAGRRRG